MSMATGPGQDSVLEMSRSRQSSRNIIAIKAAILCKKFPENIERWLKSAFVKQIFMIFKSGFTIFNFFEKIFKSRELDNLMW